MRNKSIAHVLSVLSPSILLRALAMDIFLPCLPSVAQDFAVPFSTAQWVLSIYFIGAGAGQLFLGPLADRFGRRKIILSSIVLFACSSIVCALAPSINVLILARLFQGIGACGTTVVTIAVIRDIFDDLVTPRIYSHVNAIIGLAPLLAPLLGGFLLIWTGTWRSGFYFVSVFSMLAFVSKFYFLKETNPRFEPDFETVKINYKNSYLEILRNKNFLSYTFCTIAGLTGLFLFFSMSSILLINILGVSPDNFGYYFGLNSLFYIFGNLLSPKLQKILSVTNVILFGGILMLTGACVMLAWDWLYGLSKVGFILPNLVMTFGVGLLFGPCMAGAMRPFKHIAGMASASFGALLYCTTSLIVTLVMQFPIKSAVPLAATVIVMGCLIIFVMRGLNRFNNFVRISRNLV